MIYKLRVPTEYISEDATDKQKIDLAVLRITVEEAINKDKALIILPDIKDENGNYMFDLQLVS